MSYYAFRLQSRAVSCCASLMLIAVAAPAWAQLSQSELITPTSSDSPSYAEPSAATDQATFSQGLNPGRGWKPAGKFQRQVPVQAPIAQPAAGGSGPDDFQDAGGMGWIDTPKRTYQQPGVDPAQQAGAAFQSAGSGTGHSDWVLPSAQSGPTWQAGMQQSLNKAAQHAAKPPAQMSGHVSQTGMSAHPQHTAASQHGPAQMGGMGTMGGGMGNPMSGMGGMNQMGGGMNAMNGGMGGGIGGMNQMGGMNGMNGMGGMNPMGGGMGAMNGGMGGMGGMNQMGGMNAMNGGMAGMNPMGGGMGAMNGGMGGMNPMGGGMGAMNGGMGGMNPMGGGMGAMNGGGMGGLGGMMGGMGGMMGGAGGGSPFDAIGKAIAGAAQMGLIPSAAQKGSPNIPPGSGMGMPSTGGGYQSNFSSGATRGTISQKRGPSISQQLNKVPGVRTGKQIGRSINRGITRNVDYAVNAAARRGITRALWGW